MPFVTKARKQNDPALRSPTASLNKAEQEIYDIYLRALGEMRNDLNDVNVLRAVREAVEAGMPFDGGVAFKWQEFIASLENSVPKLAKQVASSANLSKKNLPKRISYETSFEATDPRAIAWAQQRAGARISGITKESQKAVAEVIANGLRTKLTREQVIRQVTEIVGLDARQAKALANFYEKNLMELLEDGMTFEEAEREALKLSKDYRQRLLVQRATRIARTEIIAAANAGRMLSWQEADAQGLLPPGSIKRWKRATDERTCVVCAPLHNKDVSWDTVFTTGDMMPPAHPNCRCTAVIIPGEPVFAQNLEKRYYRFADGEETWRNYDYRWRKIATELKRKVGKCQRCGKKSDLTVDHKKRLKDGGAKYDRKNLRVLCRSCNGRLSRLGTKLRKDDGSWLLAKHAPGKHDQKTHGRRGGGGTLREQLEALGASSRSIRLIENPLFLPLRNVSEEDSKYDDAYSDAYPSETMNDRTLNVNAVRNYQGDGYQRINAALRGNKSSTNPEYDDYMAGRIKSIDEAIDSAPNVYGEDNLYRVYSDRLLENLQPGDIIEDKGFLSTTRQDLTESSSALRVSLGNISDTNDTVAVLMPPKSGITKGLAVDKYLQYGGVDITGLPAEDEFEVLLARGSKMLFLANTFKNGERVALFERLDS